VSGPGRPPGTTLVEAVTAAVPRWAFCRQASEQNLRVFRPRGGKGAAHSWQLFVRGAWLDLQQPEHSLNPRLSNTASQRAHLVYCPTGPNREVSLNGSSRRAASSRVMIGAGSISVSGRPQISTTQSRSLFRMSSLDSSAMALRLRRKYSATAAGGGGSVTLVPLVLSWVKPSIGGLLVHSFANNSPRAAIHWSQAACHPSAKFGTTERNFAICWAVLNSI
jgi:hypothetical protein